MTDKRIEYSTDRAAAICELVASGLALKEICLIAGMPTRSTAYKWLAQHTEFSDMYARAREERADLIADEIVTIADTDPDPQIARVRIDARKWWAAKVNPKKYGEKSHVDVNVRREIAQMDDAELAAIAGRGRPGTAPKANGSQKPH